MKWITRKDIKVDRAACPWLIRRFIDPAAEFLNEPGLRSLAAIVRAADIKGQEHVAAEGLGVRAIAEGFQAMGLSDEDRLAKQFPIYDALFAYCRKTNQ